MKFLYHEYPLFIICISFPRFSVSILYTHFIKLILSIIKLIGTPIFLFDFLLYAPLCNPITLKLSNNIIGEPEEPPSVPIVYIK